MSANLDDAQMRKRARRRELKRTIKRQDDALERQNRTIGELFDRAVKAEASARENDSANTHLWVALRDVVDAYDRFVVARGAHPVVLRPVIGKARTLTSHNSKTDTRA